MVTLQEIAHNIVHKLILPYGTPLTWITDQGANFFSQIMKDIAVLLGIIRLQTSAYHPSCNGRTEILHKTIKNLIS
jgi:hypothetical protein